MRTDLAVIGAGPAGLAAALAADSRGVRVALVDAGTGPGGQYFRQPAAALGARDARALHHQWRTWRRLRDGLAAGGVRVLTGHHVWFVERRPSTGFTVHALHGPGQDEPAALHADAVLLATGGYERVLPFPGWTLPGVVTAGGAQAMLKGSLAVPGRTVVVAGTGPLLLPVADGSPRPASGWRPWSRRPTRAPSPATPGPWPASSPKAPGTPPGCCAGACPS